MKPEKQGMKENDLESQNAQTGQRPVNEGQKSLQ